MLHPLLLIQRLFYKTHVDYCPLQEEEDFSTSAQKVNFYVGHFAYVQVFFLLCWQVSFYMGRLFLPYFYMLLFLFRLEWWLPFSYRRHIFSLFHIILYHLFFFLYILYFYLHIFHKSNFVYFIFFIFLFLLLFFFLLFFFCFDLSVFFLFLIYGILILFSI